MVSGAGSCGIVVLIQARKPLQCLAASLCAAQHGDENTEGPDWEGIAIRQPWMFQEFVHFDIKHDNGNCSTCSTNTTC